MAKDNLYQYDSTAANNLDVGGISVAEGMLPSGVNNAIRELMSHQKDFVTGAYLAGTGNVALGDAALDDGSLSGNYNTAIGADALTANTTASYNNALGYEAGTSNTTGSSIGAFGYRAVASNTTGNNNNAFGVQSLEYNTTGSSNTAYGAYALRFNTTAGSNTAVGYQAGYSNTTGELVTLIGNRAGYSNTTGEITATGDEALYSNTTGTNNTAMGVLSLYANTTGGSNTAVGRNALRSNTTASNNTGLGFNAGYSNTTGAYNVFIGGYDVTGYSAAFSNTTGASNVAIGNGALSQNTTASNNTALGYQAGYSGTTSDGNVYLGYTAGYGTTGNLNTFIGASSGVSMSTGSKNTILGRFTGNQGGLDIRTSSNNIVLSDGDGNPRFYIKSTGATGIGGNSQYSALAHFDGGGTVFADYNNGNYGATVIGAPSGNYGSIGYGWAPTHTGFDYSNNDYASRITFATGGVQVWTAVSGTAGNGISWSGGPYVTQGNASWTTYSDERLKNITGEIQNGLEKVSQLRAAYYSLISDPDATPRVGVIAQDVQTVLPEAVSVGTPDTTAGTEQLVSDDLLGVQYDNLIPLLIAALKEAKTKIETLEAKVTALENA